MKKSPSKPVSSRNILEMFKTQGEVKILCPACGLVILKSKLNEHLDSNCSSTSEVFFDLPEVKKSKNVKKTESMKAIANSVLSNHAQTGNETKAKSKATSKMGFHKNSQCSVSESDTAVVNVNQATTKNIPKPVPSLPRFKRTYTKMQAADPVNTPQASLSDQGTPAITSELSASSSPNSELTCLEDFVDNENISPNKNDNETKDAVKYAPYYIANFKHIVDNILDDEHNQHLFNEVDLKCVQIFYSLSGNAQKLYVRLFQRKYKWLRPSNMHYPDIADNLLEILEELAQNNFLNSGADNIELETALNLLSLPEVKSLSKHFNFNASVKSKFEIIQLLMKHGKQHKTLFFSGSNSVTAAMLKKVKQILGPCYRLALETKRLFTRMLMLFSLPTMSEDDEEAAGGQQQQLLTLLQVNKGELTFPSYKLSKQFQIFENRDALIRYESARQIEIDILNAIESKKFDVAKTLYLNARHEYHNLCKNNPLKRDKTMPFFLRRYSACHVYIRCMTQGVEILQKLREYESAVEQLEELLGQDVYCQDRRGQWWERLALNLDQHLKLREKAAKHIKEALQDPYVRVRYRHSLLLRAKRLQKSDEDDEELKDFVRELSGLIRAPNVVINGRLLPYPIPGRKHVFISSKLNEASSENDVTVLPVEQLALEHYKEDGYSEGIHGEGPTFISLYTLLFWDIIYDGSIPDAFISPYQTHPLDLNADDFFLRRETQITSHLEYIRNASNQELCETVRATWDAHNKKASLVSWDLFVDCEHAEGLVNCFGSSILASICERVSKDFRFTRSGVPDLVVWNPKTKLVKVVEVKGPGDKLSSKQILWLDYLMKIGADAEVCLVEAVGSKKLRR